MANKLVAAVDGVLLKVGNEIRSLYADAEIPAGADERHVKHLANLGLLVEPPAPDTDDVDGDGPIPAKSADKATWVTYAVSKGATQEEAEASTKEDLIAAYGQA